MKNVGKTDKIVRILVAFALFSLFFLTSGNVRFLGLVGFIPLVTAFMGVCPLYLPFGIHTNKEKVKNHH